MESRRERVLAYTLAKEIDNDELSKVSGGGGMTTHMTFRPSGQVNHLDAEVDVTVDW
jgi:bacteriocin-like protein